MAVMECIPVETLLPEVKVQLPNPSAVVVPKEPSRSLIIVTVLFAKAVPVNVGVKSLVILSVSLIPESLDAARSGVLGASRSSFTIVTVAPSVIFISLAETMEGTKPLMDT